MPTCSQGDVVRVPFPYTDRNTRQHRPALVVSKGGVGDGEAFLWVVMITSAENRAWPDDIPLVHGHQAVGLPVPSIIRTTKIATIEAQHTVRLGSLPGPLWGAVASRLREHLDFQDLHS